MKRVLRFLLIQTIILTIATCMLPFTKVFAASNTYDIDELELQVTIPSGYSVVTRNTSASDPVFNDFGTTKSELVSHFESSNIYLNAISDIYNEEVVVTMTEISLSNFSLLSDTVLNTFASTLANQYSNYGMSVSKYEIYQHSQAKFVRLYFTDADKTVHGLQYYTVYDGKAMNFTMRSYEGSVSTRQETTIKTIVDSIKYDKATPIADQGKDTSSFIHTDTDSGVTFTVPANWEQKAFTEDRDFIDVKFVSTKEDGCIMVYSSTDMWEEMTASEKVGFSRSNINNSLFTKADISEMYNTTADKISTITYNGAQYFMGEIKHTSDTFAVTMTQLVYIDNGWMYMFQFGGTSAHKLYSDFESLLKSVQYPIVSNVGGSGSTNNTASNNSNYYSDNSSGIIAVVVLLLIIAVIVVAVIISRKKNNKTTNYTPLYNTPTHEPPRKNELTVSCKNCGFALPLDSEFCHMCGTKINKQEEEV